MKDHDKSTKGTELFKVALYPPRIRLSSGISYPWTFSSCLKSCCGASSVVLDSFLCEGVLMSASTPISLSRAWARDLASADTVGLCKVAFRPAATRSGFFCSDIKRLSWTGLGNKCATHRRLPFGKVRHGERLPVSKLYPWIWFRLKLNRTPPCLIMIVHRRNFAVAWWRRESHGSHGHRTPEVFKYTICTLPVLYTYK